MTPSLHARAGIEGHGADLCVIIPAHNEERLIGRCVGSVLAAGIPACHVYLVDDASTDRTADVVRRDHPGVNVLTAPSNKGKAGAVEYGIDRFGLLERYMLVALLDADCSVTQGYFNAVRAAFAQDPEAALVCGSPRGEAYNYLTAFRTFDYAFSLLLYRQGQDTLNVISVAPGCASTYRASIMGALDWHGGTLVEDMDLTIQIHRKKLGRVRYVRDAVVHTQDPRRLRDFVGQLTRWHSGTWQVLRRHGLPFGGQRIDAEVGLLAAEGLLYSLFVLALPVLLWVWPQASLRWIALDQGVSALAAVGVACYLRRLDVVLWFPTFICLRIVSSVIWLRTFWLEIVCRRTLQTWFFVGRYDRDTRDIHEISTAA